MATRYDNIDSRVVDNKTVKSTKIVDIKPESSEDFYVISTIGDRFDLIANKYYKDTNLWYIIAAANPHVRRDTLFIEPGKQIRIPLPKSEVIKNIEKTNERL